MSLAVEVLCDTASRVTLSEAMMDLSHLATKREREMRRLQEELDDVQESLRQSQAMEATALAEVADLRRRATAREEVMARMNTPHAASLHMVRSACLRLAANQGGCAVCRERLTEADVLLTAACMHPTHKKCGTQWRETRRAAAGAQETCPGCAAPVPPSGWFSVPKGKKPRTPREA